MLARISRIVLMVRGQEGMAKALHFYHEVIGLHVVRATDDWAELVSTSTASTTTNTTTLNLQAVHTESQLSVGGYSPIITFELPPPPPEPEEENNNNRSMDAVVAAAVQAGGHLDGPIQYQQHGKIAALRTPDGHMIGLYEPNTSTK